MNKQQALNEGYTFQGCWVRSWKKEEAKDRAKQLRKEGNKAVVISDQGGFGVYWIESEANKQAKRELAKHNAIIAAQKKVERLTAELETARQELDALRG